MVPRTCVKGTDMLHYFYSFICTGHIALNWQTMVLQFYVLSEKTSWGTLNVSTLSLGRTLTVASGSPGPRAFCA